MFKDLLPSIDSFDQEEPSDVDNELLKVVPEPDAVEPVRGQGQVAGQLVEGVGQPLLVDGVRLAGDQVRHELVVGGLGREEIINSISCSLFSACFNTW